MRLSAARIGLAGATMVLASGVAISAPGIDELPVRKAGEWQLTSVSPTAGKQTFNTCITPDDSIVTGNDENCGKPTVKRVGKEVFVNVVCKAGNSKEKISTLFTGDFQDWYRGITKITFDPPQGGVPHMGVIVDGKFVSTECSKNTVAGE
jgi:hypothetical protein